MLGRIINTKDTYGFIKSNDKTYFYHIGNVSENIVDISELKIGTVVEFDIIQGKKGEEAKIKSIINKNTYVKLYDGTVVKIGTIKSISHTYRYVHPFYDTRHCLALTIKHTDNSTTQKEYIITNSYPKEIFDAFNKDLKMLMTSVGISEDKIPYYDVNKYYTKPKTWEEKSFLEKTGSVIGEIMEVIEEFRHLGI